MALIGFPKNNVQKLRVPDLERANMSFSPQAVDPTEALLLGIRFLGRVTGNGWRSGLGPRERGGLVLTRWPKTTFPGIIHRLTNLRLLDYTVTVNVEPLPVSAEITKEEQAHERIAGDFASEGKLSLKTALRKKERKIEALSQGHTLPFKVLFSVRVWDKTKAGLLAKTMAIKSAIHSMNGAQYFESSLPATTKKLFFQTWPGWLWGRYPHRKLYAEHQYLADMLPFSSTFTGHLASAEALYDGGAGNLVGIKTFSGQSGNQSPQHAVLLGMSGAGKSVTVCDLLSQTEPYYDYTVIIEEGLSYGDDRKSLLARFRNSRARYRRGAR